MRLSRGSWVKLGIVLVIFTLFGTGVVYMRLGMKTSMGHGSMSAAVKLRPEVESLPAPEERFFNRKAETFGIRFTNGEWVTGVAKDSHALYSDWYGGGTVVVKDSRGRVRCFFGHVCGSMGCLGATDFDSLDVFDATLAQSKFDEQQWP